MFSLRSRGEKDGEKFSPSAMPLSALEAIVSKIPDIVIGSSLKGARKGEVREAMRVSISEGSLNIKVAVSTTIAAILVGTSYVADMVAFSNKNLGEIQDATRKQALNELKTELMHEGASFIGMASQYAGVQEFNIADDDDDQAEDKPSLVDSDAYVMALVTDIGGKNKANVHLEIDGQRTIVAESIKKYLSDLPENLLYKKVLAHVAYKLDVATGEWVSARLISLDNVARRSFDVEAFEKAISKPTGWNTVEDPLLEIRRLRGADV